MGPWNAGRRSAGRRNAGTPLDESADGGDALPGVRTVEPGGQLAPGGARIAGAGRGLETAVGDLFRLGPLTPARLEPLSERRAVAPGEPRGDQRNQRGGQEGRGAGDFGRAAECGSLAVADHQLWALAEHEPERALRPARWYAARTLLRYTVLDLETDYA